MWLIDVKNKLLLNKRPHHEFPFKTQKHMSIGLTWLFTWKKAYYSKLDSVGVSRVFSVTLSNDPHP